LEKNNENNKSFQDSTTYKNINNNDFFNSQQNKKKLVSCRHCGSGDHWSMDCHISKQNKEKEKEKEREVMKINKKYDGDGDGNKNRNRNNDYEPKLKGLKITELDPSLSNNEIKDALAKFGSIVYYNNVVKENRDPNSLVYVTYSTQEENDYAYENIKKRAIGYTFPSVEYAKQKKSY